MSVTLRAGSGGSDNTAPTSLVPILPVGTDIGDLTLIFVECTNVNVSYGPATGGWQKLAEHAYAGSTNLASVIYARVWDTTPASPTIIFSDGGSNGGSISWSAISFSPGAGGTLVVDNATDTGRDYNTGTSMAVNAETANAAEVASVIFSGQRSNSVTAGTTIGSTMPTGWIQPTGVSRSTTASTFGNIGTNIGYQLAQSGTIAPGNVTMNRAASASIFHFTIAEVAAATPASIKAVGTVVNGGSAATSITLPTPASAAAGDYLVAVLYNSVGTGSTDWAMGSTGFARIGPAYIAADAAQRTGGLYGQRLTAPPPSSYTFATPDSSATRNVGVIIVLSNVDATTPVSAWTAWTETNGTATSLAIPGGGNGNDLTLEYIAADFTAGNTYAGAANDSGLTSQAVLLSPSGTENTTVSRTMVRIYGGIAPTGGVPSHTFSTTGSSSHRAAFLISFKGSNAAAAPALTASAAFSGSGALSAAAATGSSTTMTAYLTGYGYPDNDPPNSDAIAYPNAQHSVAGGVGTYADPISMATASGEWTAGTMFYVPNLRRYFRIEDLCVGCSGTRPGGTSTWLDVWVGGKVGGYTTAQTLAVENALTGAHTVIKNPPSNYVVVPGDIVATGYTSYSETPVTASSALTASAALSGSGALAASVTTGRPPVTVYRGVNDSGAEFGSTYPGVYNTDYHYSGSASLTYLSGRGHRLIRLPIAWERIQRTLGGALDAGELGRINTYLTSAAAAGLAVVVDVHNYAGYDSGSGVVKMGVAGGPTTAQFADLWTKLSTAFKTNTAVIAYGLMNEPNGLAAGLWKTASQAAVTAIRNNGDTKLLMVAGDHWSNVDGWSGYNGSTSWITDPASNFRYEGHHYFADSSTFVYSTENTNAINQGWSAGAYSDPLTNKTLTNLANWKTWLASAGVGGFIGEVGWPQNASPHTGDYAQWNTLADKWYASCDAGKVWVTAWAAGEWWSSTSQYAIYDTSGGVMAIPHTQETILLAHPSFGASGTATTAALTGSGALAATANTLPLAETLIDAFTTQDSTKWTGWGTDISVASGRLQIACTNAYPTLTSVARYDLTGSSITVEVVQTSGIGGTTDTALVLDSLTTGTGNSGQELTINVENTTMTLRYDAGTGKSDVNIAYDATAMRWWRISESSGTITWATSPDQVAWTTQRTAAPAMSFSGLYVHLQAGYWGSETSPRPALFDNVNTGSRAPALTASAALSGTGSLTASSSGGASMPGARGSIRLRSGSGSTLRTHQALRAGNGAATTTTTTAALSGAGALSATVSGGGTTPTASGGLRLRGGSTTKLRADVGLRASSGAPLPPGTAAALTGAGSLAAAASSGGAPTASGGLRLRGGSPARLRADVGLRASSGGGGSLSPISTLTDTFTAQDAAKWTGWNTGVVEIVNGQLRVAAQPAYYSLTSTAHYALTGSAVTIEVPQVPGPGNGTQDAVFALANTALGTEVSFIAEAGILYFRHHSGGADNDLTLTYNPVAHRWWLISESGGTVTWATSPNGTTWTVQRTATPGFSVADFSLKLQSGYWGTEPTPGAALFDNLNTSAPPLALSAAAALSGTGSLAATGFKTAGPVAALSGTGALAATQRSATTRPATLTGSGALTASTAASTGGIAAGTLYRVVAGAWRAAAVTRL